MATKRNAADSGSRESLNQIFLRAARFFARLARAAQAGRLSKRKCELGRFVLQTLPLSTDEYDLANRRLDNGVHCHDINEYFVAAYELTQLTRRLMRRLTT